MTDETIYQVRSIVIPFFSFLFFFFFFFFFFFSSLLRIVNSFIKTNYFVYRLLIKQRKTQWLLQPTDTLCSSERDSILSFKLLKILYVYFVNLFLFFNSPSVLPLSIFMFLFAILVYIYVCLFIFFFFFFFFYNIVFTQGKSKNDIRDISSRIETIGKLYFSHFKFLNLILFYFLFNIYIYFKFAFVCSFALESRNTGLNMERIKTDLSAVVKENKSMTKKLQAIMGKKINILYRIVLFFYIFSN